MRLKNHKLLSQKRFIAAGILMAVAGLSVYFGTRSQPETASSKTKSGASEQVVKTIIVEKKTIPITVHANGYVEAIDTVDVRPQIQNVVRVIHVREGQEVRAGQLLFTLDERNDLSNVAKAEAQLARDRAEQAEAESALKRNQELLDKNFIAQATVDTARNKAEALRSTVQTSIATLRASKVALGYNRISASIDGRLGAISVHPGSLAQPSGTPMVTIAQLDPIAVGFAVPERELAHIMTSYPNGEAPVAAQLTSGQTVTGKLVFIDNAVDRQTGTIRMKAQFENRDRLLWPGAFVNVRLVSRTLSDAVAIPAQAIVTGPSDKFVYMVLPDHSVKMQKIDVSVIEEGQAAVTGLAAGTRIVLEGAQNLRPGSKVKERLEERHEKRPEERP